jgi:hypothetical protein
MRAEISRHFDVVVVIWILVLAVGWSMVTLSHTQLKPDAWSATPANGPVWMIDGTTGN